MRVSNLQAMAYKNSQRRAAWSGHCRSAANSHHDSKGRRERILCDSPLKASSSLTNIM